ncbi:MAG: hypothetical protein ACRELD_10010, partial [Longimicrobiales bacterium]
KYPSARIVAARPGEAGRALRATGVRAAGGDIIALLDDSRPVAADWLSSCLAGGTTVSSTSEDVHTDT